MAVNSNEFRAIRRFVEPPQNMHADSLGLFKLVNQNLMFFLSVYRTHIEGYLMYLFLQVNSGLKQRSFMGFCSVFHISHPSWTNKDTASWIFCTMQCVLCGAETLLFFLFNSFYSISSYFRIGKFDCVIRIRLEFPSSHLGTLLLHCFT